MTPLIRSFQDHRAKIRKSGSVPVRCPGCNKVENCRRGWYRSYDAKLVDERISAIDKEISRLTKQAIKRAIQ